MKRSRIKPESPKHAAYRAELAQARDLVLARCRRACERCMDAPATVIHHKLRRSQGGTNETTNLVGLCHMCHAWIHDHPEESYRQGWLTKGVQPVNMVGTKEA